MAFKRRNNNVLPEVNNEFTEIITNIADATTNLDEKMVKTAEFLGISRYILSKMILSSNTSIQLIKNLSQTLENYTDVALPEQLTEYIAQIRQHILDNPINEDNLPSFFNIICSRPIIPIHHHQQYYNDNDSDVDDYDPSDVDSDDFRMFDHPSESKIKLTQVVNESIKDDVCVICLLQLCEENNAVVELNCVHQFHSDCIQQWLNHKRECPLCKKKYRL
jgi:hypothetical protein